MLNKWQKRKIFKVKKKTDKKRRLSIDSKLYIFVQLKYSQSDIYSSENLNLIRKISIQIKRENCIKYKIKYYAEEDSQYCCHRRQ